MIINDQELKEVNIKYLEINIGYNNNQIIEKFIDLKNYGEKYKKIIKSIKNHEYLGFQLNKLENDYEIFVVIQDELGYNLEISKDEYLKLIEILKES